MRQIPRPLLACVVDPHRRQEGQRQHRQGDVPVPAMPAAHLVAVQPDLLFGRLEALLDRPAPAGDPGEAPLPGGTLYCRYGKGAYIFTAYSWFRQLPAGVPGAYRIFANFLSAGAAARKESR